MGDTHCGHWGGLTPKDWWIQVLDSAGRSKRNKFARVQRDLWNFYADNIKKHGPYDLVFFNGDAIDGRGSRSGSTELITADLEEQAEMAVECIKPALSRHTKLIMTFGTPYHVSPDGEDWESVIASDLGALKIGSHEWVDVEGVMFDLKHEVGSSSVPHGRFTSLARSNLWSILWSIGSRAPRGKKLHVIKRSHVHYHVHCGAPGWLAMTLPALQGHGTKFGSRRCEGVVDFGFVVGEAEKGAYTWHHVIAEVSSQRAQAIRL